MRVLANRIQVHFVNEAERAMDTERVVCAIDQSGHIDITHPGRAGADAHEWLIEHEIAEWRQVGPEDRELFLTKRYRELLRWRLENTVTTWFEI